MKSLVISTGVVMILLLGVVSSTFGDPLPPPFNTAPFNADAFGNSAASLVGSFQKDGGPQQYRYYIGTNILVGSLIMDFAIPFTDGPGNDFAILTSSEGWGPLADEALFEFFLHGKLQASFIAALIPDKLMEFDLPGSGLVADRVVVTNITPDPPDIDNQATMVFDNAGVAYVVAEPVTIDIMPGANANPINPKSNGVIPVAILTTSDFDATTVDPISVKFGQNLAEAHGRCHVEDANGDGMLDLVLFLKTRETGIQCGDTFAALTGITFGGQAISSSDSIRPVGCR